MFGSGAIYVAGSAGGNPILLDRVDQNQDYLEYESGSFTTHTDQWSTNQRHLFELDSNFSGPYWGALTYNLPDLGLSLTDYTDVEVRCFSDTVPSKYQLQIAVGITDTVATGFNPEPASGDTSVITFSGGSSISYIFQTLSIDGFTNYGTSGYDYLWCGFLYDRVSSGGNARPPIDAYYYNIELI